MTRFLPRARKKVSGSFARFLAFTLVVSLALPLPVISEAATASRSVGGSGHVLRRLNSLERATAKAEAAQWDAAREALARGEGAKG